MTVEAAFLGPATAPKAYLRQHVFVQKINGGVNKDLDPFAKSFFFLPENAFESVRETVHWHSWWGNLQSEKRKSSNDSNLVRAVGKVNPQQYVVGKSGQLNPYM